MPTEERNLIETLRALLSVGDVVMHEETVNQFGYRPIRGYRLIVNSSVILDGEHARAIQDACGIAIDDNESAVP